MSRPGTPTYELAAAKSFAMSDNVRLVKLILACVSDPWHTRCYYCDFNGNVYQIAMEHSLLTDCRRFMGRIRRKADSDARHWTQLVEPREVNRYWQSELAIAIARGELLAEELPIRPANTEKAPPQLDTTPRLHNDDA